MERGTAAPARGRAAAEFSEDVKTRLAGEAGHRCSNPACLSPTIAAGTTKMGVGKVGQAAHISGAAEGSARWQPGMDPDERKSAANGIWLCNVHAREIDVDERRFTIALLHRWKRRARHRALVSRGVPEALTPPEPRALIRHVSWLGDTRDGPHIHQFVARFLQDVGAHWVWSGDAHEAVRMALYELTLNAVRHAGAEHLHLRARGHRIDLVYVGADFDPRRLLQTTGNGGAQALRHLEATLGDSMSVTYTHNGQVATLRLIDVAAAGPNQPCGAQIGDLRGPWSARYSTCDVIHVFMGGLLSFSDIGAAVRELSFLTDGQRAVLHGLSGPLAAWAADFPNVSVAPR